MKKPRSISWQTEVNSKIFNERYTVFIVVSAVALSPVVVVAAGAGWFPTIWVGFVTLVLAIKLLEYRSSLRKHWAYDAYLDRNPLIRVGLYGESVEKEEGKEAVVRISTSQLEDQDHTSMVLISVRGGEFYCLDLDEASDLHLMLGQAIGEYPLTHEDWQVK